MSQPELLFPPLETSQKAREPPSQRTLKIEATGDFWYRKIKPKIRLCGQWLERAGFRPGNHVRIISTKRGELTLQFIETKPDALDDNNNGDPF